MSIGKFFILAILLPMATIYLTLTLKGEQDEYVEHEVETQLFGKSDYVDTADIETKNKKKFIEKAEVSLNDKNNFSNDSEDDNKQESTESFSSIEEMIRAKKFQKNKKIAVSKNYKNIFNDDGSAKIVKKSKVTQFSSKKASVNSSLGVKQAKILPTSIAIKSEKKLKVISTVKKPITVKKSVIKKPIAKKVSVKKMLVKKVIIKKAIIKKTVAIKLAKPKLTKPKLNKNKVTSRPKKKNVIKKVTKISAKKITKPKKQKTVAIVNSKEKAITVRPRPVSTTTHVVFKKQKISASNNKLNKQVKSLSTFNTQNFGDLFDEGLDDDELDSTTEEQDVVQTKSESAAKVDSSKRFTSNPCSGRSARYIARCRKK